MKVTIDTNCLVDVAESDTRPNAPYVLELYRLHLAKKIELAITGVTASENQLGGGLITNFDEFLTRLVALGMSEIQILKPIRYLGVTFWGWDYWASSSDAELENNIHQVLFPNVLFSYPDYCQQNGISSSDPLDRNWRNKKCDVLSIHSHITSGRDVFVSSDRNFHKVAKKQALFALGAREIRTPTEIGSPVI